MSIGHAVVGTIGTAIAAPWVVLNKPDDMLLILSLIWLACVIFGGEMASSHNKAVAEREELEELRHQELLVATRGERTKEDMSF